MNNTKRKYVSEQESSYLMRLLIEADNDIDIEQCNRASEEPKIKRKTILSERECSYMMKMMIEEDDAFNAQFEDYWGFERRVSNCYLRYSVMEEEDHSANELALLKKREAERRFKRQKYGCNPYHSFVKHTTVFFKYD